MDRDLTYESGECTLSEEEHLMEEEEYMPTKFYNFNCIILYGYIGNDVALALTNNGVVNVPMTLYETPYMAKLLSPKIKNGMLMGYAIDVSDRGVCDELDLGLGDKVKKDKRTVDELKRSVPVLRRLDRYTIGNKSRPYIYYVVNCSEVVKHVFPLKMDR